MKTLIITTAILLISILQLKSQDHHFSQYDATLHYMNPALTGANWEEPYQWRANAAYRSQWGSVASRPFTNQFIGYDMPWKDGIGFGGYLVNNRAGAGYMNSLNFMGGGSYKISIDPTNTHNLYGGIHIGLFHRSLKISELIFDDQFTVGASGYEVSQSSNEAIGDKSIVRFDANMGFYYNYNDKSKPYMPWGGLSLFRITMPNESFTAEKVRMPLRWSLAGGCDYKINELVTVMPSFMTMHQGKASEYVISALADYKVKDSPWKITGGFAHRVKDAIIIVMGAKYGRSQYRISYDLNTSYLRNYSHMKGGFELTAIYIFDKGGSTSAKSFE